VAYARYQSSSKGIWDLRLRRSSLQFVFCAFRFFFGAVSVFLLAKLRPRRKSVHSIAQERSYPQQQGPRKARKATLILHLITLKRSALTSCAHLCVKSKDSPANDANLG
jgi:hypothetical protein